MAIQNSSARMNFGLLPEFESRSASFTASMLTNLVAAATVVFVAMSGVHEQIEIPRFETAAFVFPASTVPVAKPLPAEVIGKKISQATAKIELPRQRFEKSGEEPHVGIPVASPPDQSVQSSQVQAPVPMVPSPRAQAVAVVGVFGNPAGAAPSPIAARDSAVPVVGNFAQDVFGSQQSDHPATGSVHNVAFSSSAPSGTGRSTVTGSPKPAQFGSGVGSSAGAGIPGGTVTGTNFSAASPVATSVQVAGMPQSSSFVSPIVTFEPRPRYTAEAFHLKVQGEVTFEVRLCATGRIQVLRKVAGLGHGLDEEAENVIRGIQFQPAVKDGQPSDQVTLVHIYFRLA